jgi:hypothetical protein
MSSSEQSRFRQILKRAADYMSAEETNALSPEEEHAERLLRCHTYAGYLASKKASDFKANHPRSSQVTTGVMLAATVAFGGFLWYHNSGHGDFAAAPSPVPALANAPNIRDGDCIATGSQRKGLNVGTGPIVNVETIADAALPDLPSATACSFPQYVNILGQYNDLTLTNGDRTNISNFPKDANGTIVFTLPTHLRTS